MVVPQVRADKVMRFKEFERSSMREQFLVEIGRYNPFPPMTVAEYIAAGGAL